MGGESSKISKIDRKQRNELRSSKISNNINNIQQFERSIIDSTQTNTTAVVNYDDLKTYLDITSSATQQLMRDGKPFTKKDLIAILTALNPEQIVNIKTLDSLTTNDLISMIRCIIYDVNRYMNYNNGNKTHMQGKIQSSDLPITKNLIEDKKITKVKDSKRSKESNQLCITNSNEKINTLTVT